jgi:solute carrier family 25 protein 34/35
MPSKEEHYHVLAGMLGGATSGTIGAALGSPFFLVKTRIQSYSKHLGVGAQHAYTGTWNALSRIFAEDGLRGVFTGFQAAMVR